MPISLPTPTVEGPAPPTDISITVALTFPQPPPAGSTLVGNTEAIVAGTVLAEVVLTPMGAAEQLVTSSPSVEQPVTPLVVVEQ